METIVVGVDGSGESERAFRWAVRYAGAVGGRLVAVTAWVVPEVAYGLAMAGVAAPSYVGPDAREAAERSAREALDAAVERAAGDDTPADLQIERRISEGPPARALMDEAQRSGASLLVVGSRGHGGFAGLMLGSVSAALAHHTPCPLVIVPPAPHPSD